jgi:branched-chain amino acid transport system ATP-binding protein
MLDVRNLHAYYGAAHVLRGVELDARRGELVVMLGRNGAGKTTTMLSLIGTLRSRQGEVLVDGDDLAALPPHKRIDAGVALVPSGARVFANLTVKENLEIVRGRRTADPAERWTVPRVLDTFPRLGERISTMAGNLSGGERQMLAVGRALMGNPKVLLLDEPSEGLAPVIVQQVGDLLQTLRDSADLAIVLAEQNHRFALRHADRAFLIEKGVICWSGTPDELRASDAMQKHLGV